MYEKFTRGGLKMSRGYKKYGLLFYNKKQRGTFDCFLELERN